MINNLIYYMRGSLFADTHMVRKMRMVLSHIIISRTIR